MKILYHANVNFSIPSSLLADFSAGGFIFLLFFRPISPFLSRWIGERTEKNFFSFSAKRHFYPQWISERTKNNFCSFLSKRGFDSDKFFAYRQRKETFLIFVEKIGVLMSGGEWRKKISKFSVQTAISPPVGSRGWHFSHVSEGNRNFIKIMNFFVKTHRPSPKRSRGKKVSKVFGQTGIWPPVGNGSRKTPRPSSERLLADQVPTVRGNTQNRKETHTVQVQFEKIPQFLKDNGQFCYWQYELRDGDKTKVPYTPGTARRANVKIPATFTAFETAASATG